jgi:hypothetical protein
MMAKMGVGYEKVTRLEAKIDIMNAKSDAHEGYVKGQLGSPASWIDGN